MLSTVTSLSKRIWLTTRLSAADRHPECVCVCVCVCANLTPCAGHVVPTFNTYNDLTLALKHKRSHTQTHSQHRLLKSRCIYVHLQRHINTLKWPTDEGAISPLCLNGNHVLVSGWGRLGKVSPSTHYVGWPTLCCGGGECAAALCSSAL